MKAYLNEMELDEEYFKNLELNELYEKIINDVQSNNEIVSEIFLNGKKINEEYLLNINPNQNITSIKFVTKNVEVLIQETLKDAGEYLVKLKEGAIDTADLFRQGNNDKANKKYQQLLEGFDWYFSVIEKIMQITNKPELNEQGQEMVDEFNDVLNDLMNSFENDDIVLVADIIEYEIVDRIDDFMEFNKKLLI